MESPTNITRSPLGRNPLPVTARQETQIRELFYRRVRNRCAQEIKGMLARKSTVHCMRLLACSDFAACAHGRTFTSGIACRARRLSMNNCMIAHDTQAERDAAREEWFATIDKRIAEKEEKERKRQEALEMRRLYYGTSTDDSSNAVSAE